MLRTFIFNESKSHWIEEDGVLSHDICAILDEEREILYLWSGPKSKKSKFRKGYNQIKELISNFPDLNLQFVMAKKNFPIEIQNKIDVLLESAKLEMDNKLQFSRFTSIRIFSISIIGAILFPILSFLNLSTSLFWTVSNENYQVNSTIYDIWIYYSILFYTLTIVFFSINLIIGIIESENQVILFSLIGVIISVGLILYLNQDIFLFLFQTGSTLTQFLILQKDIFIFLLLNLGVMLIFEIPNIYKLISFFKTYRKFIF
ncbi:MAG: hypothetical protein ACFFDY_02820 [Candidatus Thorarchaeota archaeon]